jgi:FlaA1/EpsC-like NDP-sugar epimerase
MSGEVELADHYDLMNQVVAEMLKGSNPKQISDALSISRARVLELQNEWRTIIHNDSSIHARAREALAAADQHYNLIISSAWETASQADANQQYGIKVQALKLVADTEQKRLDMLNKAGVLENNELAEQVLETERKQKILIDILRDLPPDIAKKIASRLSDVTKRTEVINID